MPHITRITGAFVDITNATFQLIVPTILALAWLLRLEGRVNTHEAVCAERYKRLEERHDESIAAVRALESKIDVALLKT